MSSRIHIPISATTMVRAVLSWMNSLRARFTVDATAYRPEKYYMRGPGPQWHAKHGAGFDATLGHGRT